MDKKYQDIHITNWKTNTTRVIREVQIKNITFSNDSVIIELTLTIPKEYNKLIIN